jgi:hypothetical protein
MIRRLGFVVGIAAACSLGLGAFQTRAADQKDVNPNAANSEKSPSNSPAAVLDGIRWEFPCKRAMPDNPAPGADCDSALVTGDPKKTDNFTVEKKFGGEPGKHYKVTLRFRGVVEPMKYKGGERDGDYFYIGGQPDDPTYNIYELKVSSPAAHYYLNRQDATGHKIFTIDYQKTIEIDGGATLTIHGDGQNGLMISNFLKLTVPEVPPFPKPFNGQFIQANVVDVVELK